ncbi:heavy-metal-associated domain-containing protein [Tannockella kyphosi]|uniref:heavy-metal-associated domain-containing protein n=1 Tax=Tannockella kyphosi TaxID=2899121 RepID=UPI002012A03C|nr:cation transporter [Tannockella kyphosi]
MKKTFKMEDLECAHCAAKMEDAISKLDGVVLVRISFLTQKFTFECDDALFEQSLKEACKIVKKIEPDCTVLVK